METPHCVFNSVILLLRELRQLRAEQSQVEEWEKNKQLLVFFCHINHEHWGCLSLCRSSSQRRSEWTIWDTATIKHEGGAILNKDASWMSLWLIDWYAFGKLLSFFHMSQMWWFYGIKTMKWPWQYHNVQGSCLIIKTGGKCINTYDIS